LDRLPARESRRVFAAPRRQKGMHMQDITGCGRTRNSSGGARHRRKGDRIERELVDRHRALGVKAERYPLSGASRFRGSGHDIDCYIFGPDEAPAICEVKARKNGGGFVQLEKWLGEYDALFLRRDHADPLVVMPWRVWARLLGRRT
jgi:Holliday junction resolvase